jgi:uncharacterized surface protein with fasciclin (FAS1) repeats
MMIFIRRSYLWLVIVLTASALSCTKSQEPTISVGQPVKYAGGAIHTLAQLLDSVPGCTIYSAAWKKANMNAWLDSARSGNNQPVTIFVPTDNAFAAAGFTVDKINQLPLAQLDSLLLYLLVQGSYPSQNVINLQGSLELYPPLTTSYIKRSLPDPGFLFDTRYPYKYELYLGWANNSLHLNGHPVAPAGSQSFAATDGVLWSIDTLVQMPQPESYQVLTSDTVFSFYMAARRYSNQFYQRNNTISIFNDTLQMQLYTTGYGAKNAFTILAPVNDAFRRAGFNSISDITAYIDRSSPKDASGNAICTNMDSILNPGTIGVGNWFQRAPFVNTFFMTDLLNSSAINNLVVHQPAGLGDSTVFISVHFGNDNGQVVVHRNDYPNGRAAHIVAPHDIYTLNGVVHALDNLLLPNP